MSQLVPLLIHEIMSCPDKFNEVGGMITNGYYKAALDLAYYGMGISKYIPTPAEAEAMAKAVEFWKRETGWTPPKEEEDVEPEPLTPLPSRADEIPNAYKEFDRTVRSHLRSYSVHGDASVLVAGIQKGLDALDKVLRPMEKIEGGKR